MLCDAKLFHPINSVKLAKRDVAMNRLLFLVSKKFKSAVRCLNREYLYLDKNAFHRVEAID